MATRYVPRTLESILRTAAREFPAVVLTGPRQAGKTTLLTRLFGGRARYVSLEPPDVRAAAAADPRGFLDLYPPPVIIDEVQYSPDLLPYVKERIDARRSTTGQYFLTGSQNLLLMAQITESLAGRAATLRLFPLSSREMARQAARPLPWERKGPIRRSPSRQSLWPQLLRGGYPELAAYPRRDAVLWHGSYIQTYLERDVRTLRQVGDLTQFQVFLRALAARSGQLLNLTDLARDLGVAVNTAKGWLSVLEATHQVWILRPYFANVGKRLVKTPKIYFTDTGTLCFLAGLRDAPHAAAGPMAGAIFETAVLAELVKALGGRGLNPDIYFWRTAAGSEVDFVVDTGSMLVPVEAKTSATPRPAMAAGIVAFRELLGSKAAPGYLVHPGEVRLSLAPDVTALPFTEL